MTRKPIARLLDAVTQRLVGRLLDLVAARVNGGLMMPPVNRPDDMGILLANLHNRMSRLENSPQIGSSTVNEGATIYTDAVGNPLVYAGQLPSGAYGIGIYDATGHKLIELTSIGMVAYDLGANALVGVGASGMAVFDNAAHQRLQLGRLANGDYGLAAYSLANDGSFNELLPTVSANISGVVSTASATFVDLGGPSLTVQVGASGLVLVQIATRLSAPSVSAGGTTTGYAVVGLAVDGGGGVNWLDLLASSATTGDLHVNGTSGSAGIISLSPGAHTLGLLYASPNGGTSTFGNRTIIATPH